MKEQAAVGPADVFELTSEYDLGCDLRGQELRDFLNGQLPFRPFFKGPFDQFF